MLLLGSCMLLPKFLPLENEGPSRVSVRIWDEIEPPLIAALCKLEHLFLQAIWASHGKLFGGRQL